MNSFTKSLITSLIVFILLDYLWYGVIYKAKYNEIITKIQAVDLEYRYSSSLIVYLIMSLSIIIWVIPKIKEIPDKSDKEILKASIKYGGLMGITIYGVYNFSNYAVFRHWSLETGLVDTLWGGFLTSIVTYIIYAINY